MLVRLARWACALHRCGCFGKFARGSERQPAAVQQKKEHPVHDEKAYWEVINLIDPFDSTFSFPDVGRLQ